MQGKECIAQRAFTEQERAESSTYRELLAFVETWTNRQVLARFRGFTVAHYTARVPVILNYSLQLCRQFDSGINFS